MTIAVVTALYSKGRTESVTVRSAVPNRDGIVQAAKSLLPGKAKRFIVAGMDDE